MAEREHTPGPWIIDPAYPSEVQTSDLNTICSVWHAHAAGETITVRGVLECSLEESAANAAFIVRACNAHDDLVAALEAVAEARMPGEARRIARAALAEASPVEGA